MPDICMCEGTGCSRKKDCYRHRAVPTPLTQAYFGKPPLNADGSCDSFERLRPNDRLTEVHE